jgi:hypothetical protein
MGAPFLRLLVILIAAFTRLDPAMAAQLISIRGIDIVENTDTQDYVWGFDIEMHHGRILAICAVPAGWSIDVEDYGEAGMWHEGGGHLRGDVRLGHNALNQSNLNRFADFLLVDDMTPGGKQPITFEGTVTIVSYGPGDRDGPRKLKQSNFALKTADRCPAPN